MKRKLRENPFFLLSETAICEHAKCVYGIHSYTPYLAGVTIRTDPAVISEGTARLSSSLRSLNCYTGGGMTIIEF